MLTCIESIGKDIDDISLVGAKDAALFPCNLTQGIAQYSGVVVIDQRNSTHSVVGFSVIKYVGPIVSAADANLEDNDIDALPIRRNVMSKYKGRHQRQHAEISGK